METVILEKTIIKLGSLLALGFGEAGTNIIGQNMAGQREYLDAMIGGTRVECIIGVVRIRDFSTATEVLQSKIMTFVNLIAEIVHGIVDEFHGSPNKNSGDSFLVIWRIANLERCQKGRIAEMSLVAFSKILGELHCSPLLAKYRTHPGLQQRLKGNTRVNLSLGLHRGWAIEGSIGSEFKIDASYVSPNVSIANSVCEATIIYNVFFLASHTVVRLCSPEMVSKCRLVDCVTMKGSTTPIELYSIDLFCDELPVQELQPLQITWTSRHRYNARQFLAREKKKNLTDETILMSSIFDQDERIKLMRRVYTVRFLQYFNMGYQNYKLGQWPVAIGLLEQTSAMLEFEDGPSIELLRFMQKHKSQAPPWWEGTRQLPKDKFQAASIMAE